MATRQEWTLYYLGQGPIPLEFRPAPAPTGMSQSELIAHGIGQLKSGGYSGSTGWYPSYSTPDDVDCTCYKK